MMYDRNVDVQNVYVSIIVPLRELDRNKASKNTYKDSRIVF